MEEGLVEAVTVEALAGNAGCWLVRGWQLVFVGLRPVSVRSKKGRQSRFLPEPDPF
jgi:hypothetical protein